MSAGEAVTTVDDAVAAAERLGYPVVVKAQVQVGGRGKAGGIKLADHAEEIREHATAILGMDIKGHTVEIVWIEVASDIAEEYYASFTLDRSAKKHLGHAHAPRAAWTSRRWPRPIPTPSPRSTSNPVDGPQRGRRPGLGRGREAEPRRHRGRGRHPAQALHGPTPTATPTWSRSTRSSSPRTAGSMPWTPR